MLVGRCQDDGVDARLAQPVDAEAVVVDLDRHRLEAGRSRNRPVIAEARVLERDPRRSPLRESAEDQPLSLGRAARDDHLRRVGDDAAHAPEVVGERDADALDAARVAVAELGVARSS